MSVTAPRLGTSDAFGVGLAVGDGDTLSGSTVDGCAEALGLWNVFRSIDGRPLLRGLHEDVRERDFRVSAAGLPSSSRTGRLLKNSDRTGTVSTVLPSSFCRDAISS